VVRQLRDDVGGVVRLELLDQVDLIGGREFLQHRRGDLGVRGFEQIAALRLAQLLEQVRAFVRLEHREQLLAVFAPEAVDRARDVARVRLVEELDERITAPVVDELSELLPRLFGRRFLGSLLFGFPGRRLARLPRIGRTLRPRRDFDRLVAAPVVERFEIVAAVHGRGC
jgi:hypothetical protein